MSIALALKPTYQDLFTWRNALGEHCLAHHDGGVSAMARWDGVDFDMAGEQGCWERIDPLLNLLHQLDHRYFYEFHWWRTKNDSAIDNYLAYNDQHIRGGDFAKEMRCAIAQHYRPWLYLNDCAIVMSQRASQGLLGSLRSSKHHLITQTKRGGNLLDTFGHYVNALNGDIVTNMEYTQKILRTTHPRIADSGAFSADPTVFLNHQLISKFELTDDGFLYHDGIYHKMIFCKLYPDANPSWFLNVSYFNINMHIALLLKPMVTRSATKQSEMAAKFSGAGTSGSDQEAATRHYSEEKAFRQLLVDHNLQSFRNTYVIHLYDSDKDHINNVAKDIHDVFSRGGMVEMGGQYQYPYFRISQPGQGYGAENLFMRADHTWQVGSMIPTQVYGGGAPVGEQLSLGVYGQPVFYTYEKDEVNHSLSSAKTGAGKDVQKNQTIFETFPLGTNYYAIESGASYEWTFQALGGDNAYVTVDPDHTAVSPFPPYASADLMSSQPLKVKIVSGTVRAMAFLLMDDKNAGAITYTMPVAYRAAAQKALKMLYAAPVAGRDAPIFEDYRDILADPFYLDGKTQQMDAAKEMADKIDNFLDTDEGRLFNQPTNIELNPDIMGVNLKLVETIPSLFTYYLVFFSLRFSQMAAAQSCPSRLLLNEFHIFVKQSADVVGGLIDGVSRMGRKEGLSLDLVTQENEEMDFISKAVINSLAHLTLLYREGFHQEIGSRLNVPAPVIDTWSQFVKRKGAQPRNCLRSLDGDFYNILLTYPEEFLHFTSTRRTHLDFKREIGPMTSNPFERLALLQERIDA